MKSTVLPFLNAFAPLSGPAPVWLLAMVISAPIAAQVQTPPNAGVLLQQVSPPASAPAAPATPNMRIEAPSSQAAAPGGMKILVKGVQITGATAFAEDQLQLLLADAVGSERSLAELHALADRITAHYRDAGYLLARAWLPPQEVRAGIVEIAVLEGRLGALRVDNQAALSASALAPLSGLTVGAPIQQRELETRLLTLAELPGVLVRSTLRPGQALGTSDFLVEVAPGARFEGSVDADSDGNRYTGAQRLGASLLWNNPAGRGDQLSLRLQASNADFDYARLGYQWPLGPWSTRLGVTHSQMHYRLGRDFSALDAHGQATVSSLYLQQPLVRRRAASLTFSLQWDDKQLQDHVGSTASTTDKRLRNWSLGLTGRLNDALAGNTTLALTHTAGRLALDDLSAAVDDASARSAGRFGRWHAAVQRHQPLPGGFELRVSASGQIADRNLDASEKFALGGSQGVRAYAPGEAVGDEGWLASLALSKRLAADWQVEGFWDAGRARINHQPWTAEPLHQRLSGYGLGLTWTGTHMVLRMFTAWKAGVSASDAAADRSPRIGAQAIAYF